MLIFLFFSFVIVFRFEFFYVSLVMFEWVKICVIEMIFLFFLCVVKRFGS